MEWKRVRAGLAYTDVINLLSGGTLSHTVMAFLPWCAGKGIASAFGLAPGTPSFCGMS